MREVQRVAKLTTYRDLDVWQLAVELTVCVYEITQGFPADERFGLTSQMRRAAVSVPSNIAEGYARDHSPDYARFVSISRGSLSELETQLVIAGRLGYVTREDAKHAWELAQRVGMMLNRLRGSLQRHRKPPGKGEKTRPEPGPRTPEPTP